MKYFFATLCIILFTFGFQNSTQAQKPKKANKLYEDFGYKTSIPLFEEILNKKEMKEADIEKIANSYRLIHDTENAEKWYKELIQLSDSPVHTLYYAQALQSNRKYDLAKNYFLLYDKLIGPSDNRGKLLAEAIDRMNEFKQTDIQIKNEEFINSEKIDFSPAYYKNGIVFVSTRPPAKGSRKKDIWVDDHFMTLFYSEVNENGDLESPSEFSEKISTDYHEGPLTADRNGNKIFFTRSNYNEGKKERTPDDIVRLNIYTSKKQRNDWGPVSKLPFCTDEFDEMHPSLSSDGKSLYFSSNREGGFGGMDLYVSHLRSGEWSEPINMGSKINSSGNEVFPFIHDDGTLYFSSNGWGGLGGLDVFATTRVGDKYWSELINMGTPFNSPKDDFGFILNVLSTEGYLSSARDGGKGLDDIYSFRLRPESLKRPKVVRLAATFCAYDEQTKERIPDVQVSVIEGVRDESGFRMNDIYKLRAVPTEYGADFFQVLLKKNSADSTAGYIDMTQVTDSRGQIAYELIPDKEYVFLANKAGYELGQKVYTTEGMYEPFDLSICIPLTKRSGISLKGIVTNLRQGNRIPGASVTLLNHTTDSVSTITSNLLGEFSFPNLECNVEYTLTAQKEGFEVSSKNINLTGDNCPENRILNYVIQLRSLNENPGDIVDSNPPSTKVGVGTVIELEKIYYDFDDYHIREGAARTLDEVVDLLRTYPSMKIKLMAHTDSRGTWQYNRALSKNRARYARKYIVSKGISAKRIKATGWGESQLRNDCDDGIDCSEEDHQYNRRTEIVVTSFDRTDINILYLNNPPEVIHSYIPKKREYNR